MKTKATRRRMISCFAQIINGYVLGYRIPELAKREKIKARKLSYGSQMYLLMLGQFLHVFSLNELVDISKIYARELSRIRGITSANLNTFSNANRTRNPSVMERFFWMMYDHFRKQDGDFVHARNRGEAFALQDAQHLRNRFNDDQACVLVHRLGEAQAEEGRRQGPYGGRRRKPSAAFLRVRQDIGILDRAYNNFGTLHRQSERGVTFVVREKEAMLHKVVERVPEKELGKNIVADETIRLTGSRTKDSYPEVLRRVTAHVEINGNWHDFVFLTNNFGWAASTIAELYKARWQVELLFKELKQTLQLQDFFGENENAVQWQIWAALLTHLIVRYIKFKSRAVCSYSRFVAFIRAVTWLKKDLMEILRSYGIAPPIENAPLPAKAPYLPGFEKTFRRAMG